MNLSPITRAEARQLGLRPITNGYQPHESDLLSRAIYQLQVGGITHALVKSEDGGATEIWRTRRGMRFRSQGAEFDGR